MRMRRLLAFPVALVFGSAACSLVRSWDDLARVPADAGKADSCVFCAEPVATGLNEPMAVVVSGDAVYWSEAPSPSTGPGKVRRTNDGGVFDIASSSVTPTAIAVVSGHAFWLGAEPAYALAFVARCTAGCIVTWDGTTVTANPPSSLLTRGDGWLVDGMAADTRGVYWTITAVNRERLTGAVAFCAPPCPDGPTLVATGQASPRGVAIDGTYVYWANEEEGTVRRIARDDAGDGASEVVTGDVAGPSQIALQGDYVYFTAGGDGGAVLRAPKTGGAAESVALEQEGAFAIAADESGVYWTTWIPSGVVATCPLVGCAGRPRVIARAASPYGIALDREYVYFTTRTRDGGVLRAPKAIPK